MRSRTRDVARGLALAVGVVFVVFALPVVVLALPVVVLAAATTFLCALALAAFLPRRGPDLWVEGVSHLAGPMASRSEAMIVRVGDADDVSGACFYGTGDGFLRDGRLRLRANHFIRIAKPGTRPSLGDAGHGA